MALQHVSENPVSLHHIQEAMSRLQSSVHQTPLVKSRTLSEVCGRKVYLKMENMQKTGSFKMRGAANKIYSLTQTEAALGVISASAGNHAQGVAWASRACGVSATVVMPKRAPISKIRATEAYGARVILHGQNYDESCQFARELQAETGMTFIHAFDDPKVIAGQGTVALEIMSQMFDVDAIVVPIGGGGLLAGVAVAAKEHNPRIRVIGVQAQGAPAMAQSLAAGSLQTMTSVSTIADGIAVKRPGDLPFVLAKKYVDDVVLVTEEEIREGILFLLERGKMIAEGAGAVGVAALLADKILQPAQKVAVVVSGGNLDPLLLSSLITAGASVGS